MTAIALTIAGSDSGGGAGIQADLKSFSALGVYGASVITAITAQNTRGVTAVEDVSPAMIGAQIDAVLSDLAVGAIKIGNGVRVQETIATIAERLSGFAGLWSSIPSWSPHQEIGCCARCNCGMKEKLIPLAANVTPNLPEAALLPARDCQYRNEMIEQGRAILALGANAVLMKGGHGKARRV